MYMRALIIGGTGQIGRAVARALLDRGWQVALGSRGQRAFPADLAQRGVEIAAVDRNEPGALARVLGGGADVVVDTVAYDQSDADQLLDLQANVGGFVVISSASVYRDERGRTLDEARVTAFPSCPIRFSRIN
jgi:uncharacterized protein YbjT (DUF2867 family)